MKTPPLSLILFSGFLALCLCPFAVGRDHGSGESFRPPAGAIPIEQLPSSGSYDSLRHAITAACYEIQKSKVQPGHARAQNPKHGLSADFDRDGLRLSVAGPDSRPLQTRWQLESLGYGREAKPVPPGNLRCDGQRVEITRSTLSLTEWFINTPAGLEQGFTIRKRPDSGESETPLTLTLVISGELVPHASPDGQSLELRLPEEGQPVLTYDKLKVWDADSRPVSARMRTTGDGTVTFEVDDDHARYPLTIDPTITQQAYLKASNTGASDHFGWSVSISGDTAVVGAPHEQSNATGVNGDQSNNSADRSGAAYVFVRDLAGTWTQQAYLKASNTGAQDSFGTSIAISGDTIVVGADEEDGDASSTATVPNDNASNSGAAYVFFRSAGNWTQQAYLKASNAESTDWFGRSVAISGDTIVVGAIGEDSNATGFNGNHADNSTDGSGAAYVFTRSGTTWTQQAYLKASNPDMYDSFGKSVHVSGDTVVVGATGEASNATGVGGNQSDNSASYAGAAYVFLRTGTDWAQQAYLKASNSETGDYFGDSVAISGDTVAVGAFGESSNATGVNGNQSDNSVDDSGAAYVFTRSGTTWTQQAYLKSSNPDEYDSFGDELAISVDTIVVAALYESSIATGINGDQTDNSASEAGAAYVFTRAGSTWKQLAYLKASNTEDSDTFGFSIAVSGNTLIAGATGENSNATGVNGDQNNQSTTGAGAAYVFTVIRHQPDNIIGPLGNDRYNLTGAGQTQKLTSKRARQVKTTLKIENDGEIPDRFKLRGSRGNSVFGVTYQSGGATVTGAVVTGTYETNDLLPGESEAISIRVKPKASKVSKKVKRGNRRVKVWLKKKLTMNLSSTSGNDMQDRDVAKVLVQHK
ncbi:MAG: FG-GAP repeat protein [Verrucomicrobiales bacterium]|nr:FG-GAP repeat protein [Verrucomicrobiales bacterium]